MRLHKRNDRQLKKFLTAQALALQEMSGRQCGVVVTKFQRNISC